MSHIGFIGLGIMGKGMLKNLLNKLDSSTVFHIWNRTPAACLEVVEQFPERTIVVASSAAEVVKQCSVTYSMLSTLEASAAVFNDSEMGVFSAVSEGKIIVDCATLSPERMMDEATKITSRGGLFLEAPVSGSKGPAELGQLIFLCGGDQKTFDAVSAHLGAMGKGSFLFGDVGQGSRVKLVVNMIMGSMMVGFAEGLALAQSLELPLEKILQVLDMGAMSNPMFRTKGPLVLQDIYAVNFPLKHAQKDMKLALQLADEKNVPLATASAANETFLTALLDNLGDEDFSAVYKAVQTVKDRKELFNK